MLRILLCRQPICTTSAVLSVAIWALAALQLPAQFGTQPAVRARDTASTPTGLWGGGSWLNDSQNRKWRLGVRGENSEVGVVVRQVQPGSAADRARIEVDDIIVCVAGYQVGLVDGRLYDLADEINRRASETGVVSLVVQDHRSLRLARVRVQLDNSQQLLRGQLVLPGTGSLPPDAVITVQIENVTRPYFQVRNGQIRLRPTGANTIPFEIAYDPAYIYPEDIYQVRAYVTSGGRTIMDTPQPVRVLTQNNPREVKLQLQPLATTVSTTSPGSVVTAGYPNFNAIDEQLVAMYRHYLNRDPTLLELAALRTIPGIEAKLKELPLELMASQEYFDAAGNNNNVWLDRVFEEIVKRPPSAQEHEQWMRRFAELRFSRMELLRQLYAQAQRTTGQ
ncbi:MAG: hypothetical protein D6753_11930 [Planctomycetota bacterium]|nr:MAG: hypothetical protein D6753_11930 [Planctomycetota bacterium]